MGKRAGFSSHFGRQNSGPSRPWSGCMLQCYRRKLWLLFPNRFAILVRNKPNSGSGTDFFVANSVFFRMGPTHFERLESPTKNAPYGVHSPFRLSVRFAHCRQGTDGVHP